MSQENPQFKAHVFICTKCSYPLPNGETSNLQIACEFRKSVKKMALEKWPKQQVRINASGCLGQCEQGISCAIYPQNSWVLKLKEGQEERVLEKLEELLQSPEKLS